MQKMVDEKPNIPLAVKRAPVYTLGEILEIKNVASLKKLANRLSIKKNSGMLKPELIKAIAKVLVNDKNMYDILTLADDDEWVLFQKAAACREFEGEDALFSDLDFLIGLGYLERFNHNDRMIYVVPDEIKATLNILLESGYGEERAHITQLNKYALAATSLYGIILLKDFVVLFNAQNERKTSADDVALRASWQNFAH